MIKKILISIIFIVVIVFLIFILQQNTPLKTLEREVSNIVLPESIEKIAIKSATGDSGGNGNQSTFRVVLLVKTEMSLEELQLEFKSMNLKFQNHYKSIDNKPIFYVTNCKNSVFESSRNFSLTFNELKKVKDYSNYYFIEFIE